MDEFSSCAPYVAPPAPVRAYELSSDGGLIYNPISREKAEQLGKYRDAPQKEITLQLEGAKGQASMQARVCLPESFTAYDAIPITYEITADGAVKEPIHLNATAFEEPRKTNGSCFYDLTLSK